MPTKIRSNLYLDSQLKQSAKEIFKSYGLSLSDGVNLLLKQAIDKNTIVFDNDISIEQISVDDPDYKLLKATAKDDTVSLDDFLKLWSFKLEPPL